jgi:hypothetical protein
MSKGLTNSYLQKLTKKLIGSNFLGVFPCDLYPTRIKTTFSLILNTAPHNTSGEHFIAIRATKKSVFYFDSFGEPPKNEQIKSFLSRIIKNRSFNWNEVQIQDDSSNFCGFYCLAYLMSAKKKMKHDRFINLFVEENKKENDKKVTNFIVSNIKK